MRRLDGKVALVTGAARGTGEVTARLFAEEGARVVLGDVLHAQGEAVAKEIGDAALYVPLDVTDAAAWAAAVLRATEHFAPLDVLVNNAAVLEVESLVETTPESFRRVLDVNLVGSFLGVRAVVETMKAAGGGAIINVGSIDSLETSNGLVAYAASKWGVRALTKTAALELGKYGIRVNTVCPGPGSEEMRRPFVEKAIQRIQDTGEAPPPMPPHPAARRGELIDVARAILFLASDEADYISGTDLAVDGAGTAGKIVPGAPSS